MAIEIKYIVESPSNSGYPKLYKVVLEDGVETFRASPTLTEANANNPEIVQEYYQVIKDFVVSEIQSIPSSGLIPGEALHRIAVVSNCLDNLYQISPVVPPIKE